MMPLDVQTIRSKPYKIICKPIKFNKDKQKILKNAKYLKDISIFIYENLCKDTMELWTKIWNQVFECCKQDKFALKFNPLDSTLEISTDKSFNPNLNFSSSIINSLNTPHISQKAHKYSNKHATAAYFCILLLNNKIIHIFLNVKLFYLLLVLTLV